MATKKYINNQIKETQPEEKKNSEQEGKKCSEEN